MHSRRLLPIFALFTLTALALAEPLAALARAGGGQGYGGGGSGSGGFGGGGGLFSFWPLLFFGHGSGATTLIVLLVIYYLYKNYSQRQMGQFGGINPAREAWSPTLDAGVTNDDARGPIAVAPMAARPDQGSIATGIAAIKARDPNFDQAAFLDRAQTAFFKVQQAWQARNQDVARDVMSDALYERHKMQTDQLLANHQIDMLENMVIGHATIVAVTAATPYDSIVVAFSASMTDYTIDENTKTDRQRQSRSADLHRALDLHPSRGCQERCRRNPARQHLSVVRRPAEPAKWPMHLLRRLREDVVGRLGRRLDRAGLGGRRFGGAARRRAAPSSALQHLDAGDVLSRGLEPLVHRHGGQHEPGGRPAADR